MRHLANLVGALAVALAVQACVVHDTPVNMGYGYGYASGTASVGQPNPYEVSSMPPEPLYEQMTPSPGAGFVWIDGYWHWNGYEWVWVSGRWEQQQDGYVYVQPYYDYETFVYTPGYWSRPEQAPHGWHVRPRHDGRPAMVSPPSGYRPPTGTGTPPPGGSRPPTRPGGVQPPSPRGIAPQPPIYEGPTRVVPPHDVQWQPTPAPVVPIGGEPVVRPPPPPQPPAQPYEPAPIYSRPGGPPPRASAPPTMPPPGAPPPMVPRPTAPPPVQHPTAPAPAPARPGQAQPAHPVHSPQ